MRPQIPHAVLTFVFLAACEAPAPIPAPPPPAGPDIGPALAVHAEQLSTSSADSLALDGELGLYFDADGGLFSRNSLSGEITSYGEELGALGGVVRLAGEVLISGAGGLFVISDGALVRSPVADAVPDLGPAVLLSGPDEELWMAGESRLLLWRDGLIWDVQPEGLPSASSRLAWGALDGETALWVGAGDALYALVPDGDSYRAHPRGGEFAVSGLAVDGYGTLWAATGGELYGHWPDGTEQRLELPFSTMGLAANPNSGALWLDTDDGLWIHQAGTFRPVEGPPEGSLHAVDRVGRAVLLGDQGIHRLAAGRPLLFFGLEDGSELTEAVTVQLLPTVTEQFGGLSVELDGEPLVLADSSDFIVQLDPEVLDDGAHELRAIADYGEEEQEQASLFFSVGEFVPPTWADDIEPLFVRDCALCHSATEGATSAGGGHPMDSRAAWETEIDEILDAVVNGRMPLNADPYDAATISLIEDWRAGGFLE